MATLILLRHGQSEWNSADRFAGWWDVDLSAIGEQEARSAGAFIAAEGLVVDVAHSSVLTRAVRTLQFALEEMHPGWVPAHRHWRLNERHYGSLTGLDKTETKRRFGEAQFHAWRRSYDARPPSLSVGSPYDVAGDPRYESLAPGEVPMCESLADVVVRLLPYWNDVLVPDLAAGRTVLVVAHGNSLRALISHLEEWETEQIAKLEIPTGIPLVYDLDGRLRPKSRRTLGATEEFTLEF